MVCFIPGHCILGAPVKDLGMSGEKRETAAQCLQEIGEENQLEGTNISS